MKALVAIENIAPTQNEIDDFRVTIPYTYTNAAGETVTSSYNCLGSNIWSYMDYAYSLFQFIARVDSEIPAKYSLYRMWDIYVSDDVLVNMPRILTAFMSAYNPLENYNGTETTVGSGKSRNHTGGKVKNNTSISNSNISNGENSHYEATYDNTGNPQLCSRDVIKTPSTETSGSGDNNYTDYGNLSVNSDGTINVDNNHVIAATDASNEQTVTKHGNLGVTTSQQMIESEMNLRKFNIIKYIVDRFADKYLTLSR